ncbi:MAG: polymorphic toxin-type HINT domain-containing protein [Alphaproteobacteria bacterium]
MLAGRIALALALLGFAAVAPARAEMAPVPPFDDAAIAVRENSFVAGTKILTESGFKNIEDIVAGDRVISFDIDAQRTVTSLVRDVTSRTENAIYEMGIGGQVIQLTRDHPFLTTDGWRRTIETSIGDTIIGLDGAQYRIDTCRVRTGSFTVYNFEVEITGTFYVSDLRLLAH